MPYAQFQAIACAFILLALGGCAAQAPALAKHHIEQRTITLSLPTLEFAPPAAVPVPEPAIELPPVRANTVAAAPSLELPPPPLVEDDDDLPLPPPDPTSVDVWQRLRSRFELAPQYRDYPRVQQELLWYARNADYLSRVSERAAPYLHYIAEEAQKRNMPAELVLLPIIESAFQPYAYSPGRAAGIWQFIPDTARHFGLRLTWWYDGRRDVMASTQAAFNYLQRLHKQMGGDWLLALAAYNNGEGNIMKAMAANRQQGLPTDFWSLQLRQETSSYVPRLLAVAAVIMEAPRYGLRLYPVPDKTYLAKIDTGSQLDLAIAADLAGLKVEEMYKLNPGFNRWATDPDGPHYLVVPADKAESFQAKLAALSAKQRMRWTHHTVAKRETLLAVARRYDTSVDVVRRLNKLGDKDKKVKAGTDLLVPLARNDVVSKGRNTQTAKRGETGKGKTSPVYYTVRGKDTLYAIAKRRGVSVQDILALNSLSKGASIHAGQRLIVAAATKTTVVASANLPVAAPDADAIKRRVSYTVRSGESLKDISRRFNVSETQVRKWNDLSRRERIQPGQIITLFVDVTNLAETS